MDQLPSIDQDYLVIHLQDLLNTPSPTGFAHQAIEHVRSLLQAFPQVETALTRKGALVATWPGASVDSRVP